MNFAFQVVNQMFQLYLKVLKIKHFTLGFAIYICSYSYKNNHLHLLIFIKIKQSTDLGKKLRLCF